MKIQTLIENKETYTKSLRKKRPENFDDDWYYGDIALSSSGFKSKSKDFTVEFDGLPKLIHRKRVNI
jgi:hypothetical protein